MPRGVGRGPSGFLVLMLHEMEGPDFLVGMVMKLCKRVGHKCGHGIVYCAEGWGGRGGVLQASWC